MVTQSAAGNQSTGIGGVASLLSDVSDENPLKPVVGALLDKIESQDSRIDELERRVDSASQQAAGAHERINRVKEGNKGATEYAHNRIDRLEAEIDGETPTPDGSESTPQGPDNGKTPLENVTNYPEHVAKDELTENQQRARFVAKDITDYATKSPKGYTISSSEIAQVLTVRDGKSPHTETTTRVIDFLNKLGKEDVYVKFHKGKKLVVFENKDAAERYGKGRLLSQSDVISERTTV